MKKTFKVIGAVLAIAILGFISMVIYFILNPEPTEIEQAEKSAEIKTGIAEINSIDQMEKELIPLSKQLIIAKYPIFQGRVFGEVYNLDKDNFIKRVTKELQDPKMSKEESVQLAVSVGNMQGITFCPDADVYLMYLGNTLPVNAYLHHAIHELLHSVACSKGANFALPSVWEESFTDYFTANIMSDYLGMDVDSFMAFPMEIKIVRLLSNFISEDELLSIYRTKNITLLENLIDKKIGKGSYRLIYEDMEIIYREKKYNENGVINNPIINDAMIRVEKLLNPISF